MERTIPKFDATQFSDVEYDLTGFKATKKNATYEVGQYIQDKGTVPEPSRHLVGETMKAISAAFKTMDIDSSTKEALGDSPSPEQITELMSVIGDEDESKFEEMGDTLVETVADFCQGHPTLDSLDALAWPKFMAFFGYLMEHMLSPEASVPGTNSTPRALKSV